MTDGPDLLERILAEPDEDLHRLQYADWLEENAGTLPCGMCKGEGVVLQGGVPPYGKCGRCGKPGEMVGSGRVPDGNAARAEFIRVQCELARLYRDARPLASGGHIGRVRNAQETEHYLALRRRERALLIAHEQSWSPETTRLFTVETVAGANNPVAWRRGFVESVTLSAADWLAHERVLYWRPGLSDPCPECGGAGGTICPRCRKGGDSLNCNLSAGDPCPACSGKGTVPRPMPPTAWPITRVRLTTSPGYGNWLTSHVIGTETRELELTNPRWPGITFQLSTAAPG